MRAWDSPRRRSRASRDLSDPEKRSLEAQVEKLTGKKVRARYLRDAGILGGAVVRVGSTIYDGSVLGQLESIREEIAEAAAHSRAGSWPFVV